MKAKGKKTTEVVFELTLSMTEREAMVLYGVTRSIGGSPKGPRATTDKISHALSDMGLKKSYDFSGDFHLPETWEGLHGREEKV